MDACIKHQTPELHAITHISYPVLGLTFTHQALETKASLSKLPAKQMPHLVHVTVFLSFFFLTIYRHNELAQN